MELLLERGYSACELDFESGFWLDYPGAERLGELARANDIALSVHAPLFAFPGHPDPRKSKQALGALDRTAGLAASCGAELVVIHPGFWLGRDRDTTLDDVVTWLVALRERLEAKERALPFGLEVMGRVSELGSIDDVVDVAGRLGWVRPVVDFAHMHATTDGAFTDVDAFAAALESADACSSRARRSTSISRTSPSRTGTRRSTCPTARERRADPLDALDRFERPATVISESPDEASSQAIKAALEAATSDGDELGVAGELVVDRVRLADPAAVAEEAGQRREQLAPDQEHVPVEHGDRLAQKPLGLLVPALRGADETERHPGRRAGHVVVRPHCLARLQGVARRRRSCRAGRAPARGRAGSRRGCRGPRAA